MRRTAWLEYAAYAACFVFFRFLEARLGIYAFSLPFLMALAYNKRNLFVLLPLFFGSAFIFAPVWQSAAVAALPTLGLPLVWFVHYKLKKPLTLPFVALYLFLFGIPAFVFGGTESEQIVLKAVGAAGAQVALFGFVHVLYALLVRRFRYPLTGEEGASFGGCAFLLGMGLKLLETGAFSPFYFLLAPAVAVFAVIRKESVLSLSFALGLGGAIAGLDPDCLALSLVFGGIARILAGTPIPLTAVAVVVAEGLYGVVFKGEIQLTTLIAPAVGGMVVSFIPKKILLSLRDRFGKSAEGQTARVLVNRERKEVAGRIEELSRIFTRMEEVLATEPEDLAPEGASVLAEHAELAVCGKCAALSECKKILGDAPRTVIEGVARAALESGKASILDMPPFLSSVCKKPNLVLSTLNEGVKRRREEEVKRVMAAQSRRLLGRQMGGMGEILDRLGSDVARTLSYDTEREKKLLRALSAADVYAVDAIVYGAPHPSVVLSIAEGDLKNPRFSEAVYAAMGVEMEIVKQEKGIGGTVSVRLEPAARYRVVYAERKIKAKEGEDNGDVVHALRLPGGKVMLILSDGMGQGDGAGRNSRYVLGLVEGFYRLGFDHETVVRSLSGLLGAKTREEFDALDVALIDTYTGKCDFIKLGGRESFLLGGGEVRRIECGSLPLGIVEEGEAKVEEGQLSEGEFLVLASDGVIDALGVENIERLLLTERFHNPDRIAELLMENTERLREGGRKDDASVLVAKLLRA